MGTWLQPGLVAALTSLGGDLCWHRAVVREMQCLMIKMLGVQSDSSAVPPARKSPEAVLPPPPPRGAAAGCLVTAHLRTVYSYFINILLKSMLRPNLDLRPCMRLNTS